MEPSTSNHASAQPGPNASVDFTSSVEELLKLYVDVEKTAMRLSFIGPSFWQRPADWEWKGLSKVTAMGEINRRTYLRPLVIGMLHWHFRNRLMAVRKMILLETRFSESAAKNCLERIDRAIDFWRLRITIGSILFGWFIPLAGPATAIWKWVVPQSVVILPPEVIWIVCTSSAFYCLLFLTGSFVTKRGLMLGGSGFAASNPYLFTEPGGYAREREILGPMGIAVSELPIDLICATASVCIIALFQLAFFPFLNYSVLVQSSDLVSVISALGGSLIMAALVVWKFIVRPWRRRKSLGRM